MGGEGGGGKKSPYLFSRSEKWPRGKVFEASFYYLAW